MSKFYEVSQDTQDTFFKVFNKKSFPLAIKFQFVGCENQKTLMKISKLPDQYCFLLEKELMVQVNEDLMSVFDEESITILIEQEIDKVTSPKGCTIAGLNEMEHQGLSSAMIKGIKLSATIANNLYKS